MKIILNFFILTLWTHTALAGLFRSETTQTIMASNVCTYCVVDIQSMMNSGQISTRNVRGNSSVLVLQNINQWISTTENTAIAKLQSRILWFAEHQNSYAARLVRQSRIVPKINHKLYYQLALDSDGKSSIFSARSKPTYEIEKEIPHELWGYYSVVDDQAYVFINEYQNLWNADYSLIHELSHIYDRVSGDYLDKIKASEKPAHPLDDLVIEFRSVLAEVTYRHEVKTSTFFEQEILLKDDFRDELISGKKISNERILNFVLDLFYPIKFKESTTEQLITNSGSSDHQNRFIFEVMDEFFKNFVDKLDKDSHSAQTLGLSYKSVPTDPLVERNRGLRAELVSEARRRGASDLMDYLIKNNFTQPLTADSVRQDGRYNQWPQKTGGPSPRGGGGSP